MCDGRIYADKRIARRCATVATSVHAPPGGSWTLKELHVVSTAKHLVVVQTVAYEGHMSLWTRECSLWERIGPLLFFGGKEKPRIPLPSQSERNGFRLCGRLPFINRFDLHGSSAFLRCGTRMADGLSDGYIGWGTRRGGFRE